MNSSTIFRISLRLACQKKGHFHYIIILAIIVWLATGIFIIDPEEQGVIKRFGEVTEVVGPGPHYHLPSPIETVQIAPVTAVRRLEIGFRTVQTWTSRQIQTRFKRIINANWR